jgi:hypothetical protein
MDKHYVCGVLYIGGVLHDSGLIADIKAVQRFLRLGGECMNDVIEPDFRLGLCAVCGKKPATQFCDYIIEYHNNIMFFRDRETFNRANRRGEQYETCDLPMCMDCTKEISRDHGLCPHHYELYLQRELPDKFQQRKQSFAKGYIASKSLNIF